MNEVSTSNELRVIIHIGAPKTGSSAIQKALIQSLPSLARQKVFYPEHELDPNGVSSGNVLSVYDRLDDGSLILNREKIRILLDKAELLKSDTLLLSSEYFFNRVVELSRVFKGAVFYCYIRSPIELVESAYNQSVKRHEKIGRAHV